MIVDVFKRYSWIYLVMLAVALSGWLANLVPPTTPVAPHKATHDLDYAMDNFTVTQSDTTGLPHYRLRATRMEHYPDDDSAHLTQPHLEFYEDDRTPWNLDALTGDVSAGAKEVLLHGVVTIVRPETPTRAPLRVDTSELRVVPHDQYAETRETVMIRDPLNTTRAVGAQVQADQQRIRLLSKVQGTYEQR